MTKIIKPKYGVGEIVIIKCDDCRRKHKGQIIELGSLFFSRHGSFSSTLGPVKIGKPVYYHIKYRNHVESFIPESDILKVYTIATMKALKE